MYGLQIVLVDLISIDSQEQSIVRERFKRMSQKPIVITTQTKEKVEAAKIFIEQRYSKLILQEQEKREYWDQLNQKMKNMHLSGLEQDQIKNRILHKEAEKLRTERKKLSIVDFPWVKIIGKGAFGEVRLCRWSKNSQPVAVKKLKKQEMIYKNKVIQVREERNVLANSDKNPWIVGLQCSFQDTDYLYLVMDYVPGGDLMNMLIKKDIFSHDEARFYIAEMILAIHSIHKFKYIHRDIKPDNILVDADGHIKLSDFGLCKHTETRPKKLLESIRKKQEDSVMSQSAKGTKPPPKREMWHRRKLAFSAVGTPDYVAPQVQGKGGYTETVDWWATGVIFFEMLVGYPPFASENASITWQKIQNWRKFLVIPSDVHVSQEAADLIRKLVNDPNERLGANGVEEIKAHPFFKGVDWENLRKSKPPNIPQLKNPFDTSCFDAFEEEEPWISIPTLKGKNKNKKGTEFIGYTFKPEEESNSELVKALIDLDNYRIPQQLHRNNIESLYLEQPRRAEPKNTLFKKGKMGGGTKQEFYATTTVRSPKYSVSIKEGWEEHGARIVSPATKNRLVKKVEEPVRDDKKKPVVKILQKRISAGDSRK